MIKCSISVTPRTTSIFLHDITRLVDDAALEHVNIPGRITTPDVSVDMNEYKQLLMAELYSSIDTTSSNGTFRKLPQYPLSRIEFNEITEK